MEGGVGTGLEGQGSPEPWGPQPSTGRRGLGRPWRCPLGPVTLRRRKQGFRQMPGPFRACQPLPPRVGTEGIRDPHGVALTRSQGLCNWDSRVTWTGARRSRARGR